MLKHKTLDEGDVIVSLEKQVKEFKTLLRKHNRVLTETAAKTDEVVDLIVKTNKTLKKYA